jgi:type II secretory pathway component HofQ
LTQRGRDAEEALRQFLTATGVSIFPPNRVYFKDRMGILMVRASAQDLDRIQRAIDDKALLGIQNEFAQRQISLAVQFVELTEAESREMGFVWFQVLSILTESQFQIVQQALEQSSRLRVIGTNRLTTVNGHRARIGVPSTDEMNLYLDCLPTVRSPHKLELAAGFRTVATEGDVSLQPGASAPSADQPRTESRAVLWTGQTMVLSQAGSEALPQNADATPQSRRQLFAFITPTISDPIGIGPRPRHFFDPDTIPPQDLD